MNRKVILTGASAILLAAFPAAADDNVSKILFLNRCEGGCLIQPGQSDARFNTSSIAPGASVITEFEHGDAVWNALVQCVREIYAPYDLEVTDVDPGDGVFHHEAIVAGNPSELDLPGQVGGIAPSQCIPQNNVISFTFANHYGPSPLEICSTVAQESAHSYGLEHLYDCSDPMTYLPSCGRQFFRDAVTECGEYEARPCQCGGSAKSSHRWLKEVLGENSTPVPGPDLTVTEPSPDAQVQNGFLVAANATHLRGIGHVDFYINGTKYDELEGFTGSNVNKPYVFSAPADLADSILDIEVRAYNDIGSESIEMVTVTKGAPCGGASDCNSGQSCDAGRCVWPPADGELGDSCSADGQCMSGECLTADGGEAHCTQDCFPTTTENTCPDGFECLDLGGNEGRCWPEAAPGGCGCSAGASARSSLGAALLGLFAIVIVTRRRRCR